MEYLEFEELIKNRRSIHNFKDKPVPEELIIRSIELATWAPNPFNRQQWLFCAVLNKETIIKMADAMDSVNSLIASWPGMLPPMPRPGDPAHPQPHVGRPAPDVLRKAPAAIAVASLRNENEVDKLLAERALTDAKAKQIVDGMKLAENRVQSVCAATAYLQLALHQAGLGSLWTGPGRTKTELEAILGIPQEYDLISLLIVGYAAETPAKERKPVNEVMKLIK